jgi:hypothetical protein
MCPVRCTFNYVSCGAEYIVYDSIDKMPRGRSSVLRTSCLKTKSGGVLTNDGDSFILLLSYTKRSLMV